MKQSGALVLLSGGQDSTTCLFWAKREFEGPIVSLNLHYGQRHVVEMEAAETIAAIAKTYHVELDAGTIFNQIGDSLMVQQDGDISSAHRVGSLPASFLPGRNVALLTFAAAYAYKHEISNIVTGVCQTDFSGYPDCRDNTIKATQVALSLALAKEITIHTPLMYMTKAETVQLAKELDAQGYPAWEALAHSHTCYNGVVPPCLKCPACKLRVNGFLDAGYADPLVERTMQS
jgi:7-cyano-7-deazaguanine synthase